QPRPRALVRGPRRQQMVYPDCGRLRLDRGHGDARPAFPEARSGGAGGTEAGACRADAGRKKRKAEKIAICPGAFLNGSEMLIRYAGMRYPQRLAAMRINFGTNDGELAPTAVRYDVAWCVIQPEFRAQSKKICWWLDSSFPIEAAAAARLKELQGPLTQNNGNLAIYEVQHDNT